MPKGVDAVWCLGDTVGYGPRPNECCDAVSSRSSYSLVGNHDLVVLGELSISDFNDDAAEAALWTSQVLTQESRAFLEPLQPAGEVAGVDLFHASARDPVWEYVLTEEAARGTFELSDASLILVGHSHVALALSDNGDRITGGVALAGSEVELEGRWLLNPGSVGQPRDGDPRAAWLLLDSTGGLLRSAGSHTRLSRRRPRCESWVYPSPSQPGSSVASKRSRGVRWRN